METVWKCTKDSVLLLLAHGADVNAQNLVGETALSWAARKQDREKVDILLKAGAKMRLYEAAWLGENETIRELVAQGADINERIFDLTPLLAANSAGHAETVALLRQLEAKIFTLHEAAQLGDSEAIRGLARQGHNLNAIDEGDNTPLMTAIKTERVEAVRTLIALGADVNLVAPTGMTAMSIAQACGLISIVEMLEPLVHKQPSGIK